MSNAFDNFLGGVIGGTFGPTGNLRDYQHANRLYVANNYARAPKVGFIYFVVFNINPGVVQNVQWANRGSKDIGFLVKKIDLPKFGITNEVLNQYNKKTIVQSAIKYNPINVEFHDDNSDITTGLWSNYYKYYYADGKYGDYVGGPQTALNNNGGGTKYGTKDYRYGLNNGHGLPFFTSIDVYVLHQQKFTKITLQNPMILDWAHDSLNQEESSKILANKMTVGYEAVTYSSGRIDKNATSGSFTAVYYDRTPSPLSVGGNGSSTLFGPGGVIAGADGVFGAIADGNYLAAAITAATTVRNAKNLTASGITGELTAATNNALTGIAQSGQYGGKYTANGLAQAGISGAGQYSSIGISLAGPSTNSFTSAKPVSVTGK